MSSRVVCLVAACVLAINVGALNFASERLQSIAQSLGIVDTIASDMHYRGRRVCVEADSSGMVTHIGYDLFPESVECDDVLAYKFIERYLLQLHLPHSQGATPAQQMKSDAVVLSYGTLNDLMQVSIDSCTQIVLERNAYRYHFTLYKDYELICEMTFPVDYQLLTGRNKIELERQFVNDIHSTSGRTVRSDVVCEELDTTNALFNVVGESLHFFKDLKNDIYLRKDTCALLFNPIEAPEATLLNLLQEHSDSNYSVQATYVLYNTKVECSLPLNNWVDYAKQTGCEIYVGLENKSGDDFVGVCVAYNQKCNYFHLMKFRFPTGGLLNSKQVGQATIHAYVDLSRIKDLR